MEMTIFLMGLVLLIAVGTSLGGEIFVPGQFVASVLDYYGLKSWMKVERYDGFYYTDNMTKRLEEHISVVNCLLFCLMDQESLAFNIKVGESCQCIKSGIQHGYGDLHRCHPLEDYRHYYFGPHGVIPADVEVCTDAAPKKEQQAKLVIPRVLID